jgi:hypothetical protein
MTIETDIQAALIVKLTTPALSSPAPSIAYPLIAYTPTAGTAYLAVHPILRATPRRPAIAFTGSVLRAGIFQVDAVTADNAGEGPGLRLADLVAARFPLGTELTVGAYKLLVNKDPIIAAAVKDAPWVRFPVSISYLVIT